ncbi:helix-turn-helix domain-containing protein [Nonomuraea sp. NPDC049714]|uniref:helix-turn-helix domain-containing protein n=1 Tax=Nonomuraea sp. NPDC049714 TaxID=3364357 RepID=UPI003788E875
MGDLTENTGKDPHQSGPTALRILVGAQLRRMRESQGITREAAGYAIRSSHSKISRIELGRSTFKARDVADLLTLYGVVEEAERSALLILAERANAVGWWHEYRDAVPDWFDAYLGLEQDAALIRAYAVQFVPGLLQTEDYARAVLGRIHEDSPDDVEPRVALRMRRQRILTPPTSHRLWLVMDESVLHRKVGDTAVMRAQLAHLAELAEQPHITIQLLPLDYGGNVGGVGSITILRFAEAEVNDVVYLEQIASAQYLTKQSDVDPYQQLMNELGLHARPATDTPAILRELMASL